MSWLSPVVWSPGMFLQPHHFQQEARFVARSIDSRARCSSPYAWGFFELVLDEALLALGRVGIARASGVLPDGTPFTLPQLDAPPEPIAIPPEWKNELVVLCLALSRQGITEVGFSDQGSIDRGLRFEAVEEEVRDHTDASDEPARIQTGRLRLQLMRATEARDGYAALGIAHVVECRADHQVVLDRTYIPPVAALSAAGPLLAHARLLQGLVSQRAQALAGRMGQLSHGVSEVADFMMLQVLNRAEPLFRQFAALPNSHPQDFHAACLQLAGELATFATAQRRPPEFVLYQHDALKPTFESIVSELRTMLSVVLEQNAMQIELVDRKHGVRTAVVADLDSLKTSMLVLAVRAQLPAEQLRMHFNAQTKIGPVERIRDLVNLQLAGIAMQSLPVAPRQIPFHAGSVYFELERHGELWRQFERSGSLAMHVAGDFPGLELELWSIRQ